MELENFFLKANYSSRTQAKYCAKSLLDPSPVSQRDAVIWQPEVYPFAAEKADELECQTILDLGCGDGQKLVGLRQDYLDWRYVGIDTGTNLEFCQKHHSFGTWIDADLELGVRNLPKGLVENSLMVCADVIEHLTNPKLFLDSIVELLRQGSRAIVLSTPERDLTHGKNHFGPPPNLHHVREWNRSEFRALLEAAGLKLSLLALTPSNDATFEEKSILAVASL